jgi:hypothetical protein
MVRKPTRNVVRTATGKLPGKATGKLTGTGPPKKYTWIWIVYAQDKNPGKGFFESPRNVQNGPEMGPKMLFSSWAGARGPGTKMDPWANP